MERMVLEVALKGDVASLKKLLEEDPLILERCMVSVYSDDTPLHVAAMLGHEDFANEILSRKPELAKELNSKQSSPLHLAAAMGHAGVVRALLLVDRGMLKGRDRDGLTPFHLAALKGRVEVLKELMMSDGHEICSSELLSEVMGMDGEKLGESILHMCVNHGQLEALKLLAEMIADKDGEAVKYLVQISRIQVNAENNNNNGKEMEVIEEVVARRENSIPTSDDSPWVCFCAFRSERGGIRRMEKDPVNLPKKKEKYKKNRESWVNEMREGLMVAASLLATMAFQAIVNPPGGVLSENRVIKDVADPAPAPTSDQKGYIGQLSAMSYYQPIDYQDFVVANTLSFVASLSVILLLISGLPLHRKFFMYVLMITMWVAIIAAGFSYVTCMLMITNYSSSSTSFSTTFIITLISSCVFVALGLIIGAGYVIKVTVEIIKWLRTLKNKKKKKNSSTSMLLHQV